MKEETALVNKEYLLQKFPGKGGWTYAIIPEVSREKRSRFGWVQVRGHIDGFELKNYKLMPLSNGDLFLPVKAEIRKTIGKEAGDRVRVILYEDQSSIEIPEELGACLEEDPIANKNFLSYTDGQRKEYIDWIYSAKTDETKVKRIVETLNRLGRGKKFRDR